MIERKSNVFLVLLLAGIILFGLMLVHAAIRQRVDMPLVRQRGEIVRVLGISDLCLVTEARYTRHPSLADLNTPFQDHPLAIEHFPSGSIITVPPHLKMQANR
jgi:hypothetical protein